MSLLHRPGDDFAAEALEVGGAAGGFHVIQSESSGGPGPGDACGQRPSRELEPSGAVEAGAVGATRHGSAHRAAPEVEDQHEGEKGVQIRPDFPIVEVFERQGERMPEGGDAEKPEDGGGAQPAFKTIQGIGA